MLGLVYYACKALDTSRTQPANATPVSCAGKETETQEVEKYVWGFCSATLGAMM